VSSHLAERSLVEAGGRGHGDVFLVHEGCDVRPEVLLMVGPGRIVALHHPRSPHTRFAKIIGTFMSEATMRPNPTW
jgi:hypothetical protein